MSFNPNAHPEISSVDGFVWHRILAGITWAAMVIAAGNNNNSSWPMASVAISAAAAIDKWQSLDRIILLFDTSPLPDDCTIISAVLATYCHAKSDGLSILPNMNVYSSLPASDVALVDADFTTLGAVPFCDIPVAYNNFVIGMWNSFVLNAAGIAAIEKAGITKLGLRNVNYDVDGVIPTWAALQLYSEIQIRTGDTLESEGKPTLTVTYTQPPWGINFPMAVAHG
jgi:hypothetical protein